MMKIEKSRFAGVVGLLAIGLAACGDGGTGINRTPRLQVLLTDAPVDYVDSALVDIGRVSLIPSDGTDPVVLSDDGTSGPVDLLALQNAATTVLADATIPAGTYSQIRLIVESASVKLVSGHTFPGGSSWRSLVVPSGAQTGIKLNLGDGGVAIDDDMVLVIDFDVSRSFVIQGNPETPAGIRGMHFQPTLRVVIQDVAASISGSVTTALTTARIDSLTVAATPVDSTILAPYQTQAATTMTDLGGDYTLHFLVPGSYWVKVAAGTGLKTQPDSILVDLARSEDEIDVDFAIVTGP